MRVLLFGATGMVGQGALLECLRAADVSSVVSVGRSASGRAHEKLREVVRPDLSEVASFEDELAGHDACLFCLGVSSVGMNEASYTRITYDTTMGIAEALIRRSPGLVFVFVSGEGTDATETSRTMWARVKGRTENALSRLPFKASYMFRPGYIQPLDGIRARSRVIRVSYAVMGPLYPLVRRVFSRYVTTTQRLGRAMLEAARGRAPTRVLQTADINALAPDV